MKVAMSLVVAVVTLTACGQPPAAAGAVYTPKEVCDLAKAYNYSGDPVLKIDSGAGLYTFNSMGVLVAEGGVERKLGTESFELSGCKVDVTDGKVSDVVYN